MRRSAIADGLSADGPYESSDSRRAAPCPGSASHRIRAAKDEMSRHIVAERYGINS